MRKFVDAQRNIAFWSILFLLSIDVRNENEFPWTVAGIVKVRAIDWN